MKRLGLILIALTVGLVWLMIGQYRLIRQVEALRLENAHLTQMLNHTPSIDPADLAALTRRIEDAGMLLSKLESRLANTTAPLTRANVGTRNAIRLPRGPVEDEPMGGEPIERSPLRQPISAGPSSSHSPTGEVLHRNWGPEQVLGAPDTFEAGDRPTAWAPRSPQGTGEWLQVNYDRAVDLAEIRVLETYNPGAIAKVMAVLPGGVEALIWQGVTPPAQAPVDTAFPVNTAVRAQSVKIYFDRTRAPGWNEVDAVELVARDGTRQWATSASASSSFADP